MNEMKMKAKKTRNELKVSDSKTYPLKNEERMKNDGKPSRIFSQKRLGSTSTWIFFIETCFFTKDS